jgi:hypothetical protein
MATKYQARWISRKRLEQLRRSGDKQKGLVLDHFNGTVIIEPVGSDLGDGLVLSPQEAEYELQPAWLLGPRGLLNEARRRLGLEVEEPIGAGAR